MNSDPSERSRGRRWRRPLQAGSVPAELALTGAALLPVTALGTLLAVAGAGQGTPSYAPPVAAAMILVLALNACFVAAEVAIESLRPSHLRAVQIDERRAGVLRSLLEHKARYVAGCFLGSQTMRFWLVILCFVPAPALAARLNWEGHLGTLGAAVVLSLLVAAVNVVFGELVPKSYAATHAPATALRLNGFVRVWTAVFRWPAAVAAWVAGLVTLRFGARASFVVSNQAEEEIKTLIESAEETGEIEEEEKEMLASVFEFGDTVAREIMTPRVDVDSVPVAASLRDVAKVIVESGHSRIPVYEETDDQILGIVHAKDVLSALADGDEVSSLRRLMRPALFVPENKSLHDLLQEMRATRSQMVVVQDEFGGTAGVVTVEDIVEEVVGEIVDEYDDERPPVVRNGLSYLVDGKIHLDDLNAEIGTELVSDEFDTLGGYVFGLFGRQPKQGERKDEAGYCFTVEVTDGRRIQTVRVEAVTEDSTNAPDWAGQPA